MVHFGDFVGPHLNGSFNIWAFIAAGKAVVHHLHHQHSHGRLAKPSRSSTSDSRFVRPSRSSTFDTISSDLLPSSPTTTGTTSTAPSTAPSLLDLTKPIITSAAASEANREGVDNADIESEASSDSDEPSIAEQRDHETPALGVVTVRGAEPTFGPRSIVSERVSTHGRIRPFEPIEEVPALHPDLRERIGQVHGDGAIQKWLEKRTEWDRTYASQLSKWRKVRLEDRARAEVEGFLTRDLQGERPPLCALVGWYDQKLARGVGKSVDEVNTRTSGAMAMWMRMSSKVCAAGRGVGEG